MDRLREETARLKARLRYQERTATEGFFGSSTPSAKVPVKTNTTCRQTHTAQGGARPEHCGHGRARIPAEKADPVILVSGAEICPDCGGALEDRGCRERTVLAVEPLRRQTILYHLQQKYCRRCRRAVRPRPPGVFKRHLRGNRLLAHVAVQHYVLGVTLGSLEMQLGVGGGALHGALQQWADRVEPACDPLLQEYRQAPVKHADETGWRTDGGNGYAWLFCTQQIGLFCFRQTRSGQVAQEVLGQERLTGVLVVDRYNGCNRAPCELQYGYAHLLRDVQDLEKELPENVAVTVFVSLFAPLLSAAMKLRGRGLEPTEFPAQARPLKERIIDWSETVDGAPGSSENPEHLPGTSDPPLSLG